MVHYVRVASYDDAFNQYSNMRGSGSVRRAGSNECGPGHAASLSCITDNLQR